MLSNINLFTSTGIEHVMIMSFICSGVGAGIYFFSKALTPIGAKLTEKVAGLVERLAAFVKTLKPAIR